MTYWHTSAEMSSDYEMYFRQHSHLSCYVERRVRGIIYILWSKGILFRDIAIRKSLGNCKKAKAEVPRNANVFHRDALSLSTSTANIGAKRKY